MRNNDILNYVFDDEMCKSILDFAQTLSCVVADTFIVMSRKAACFINFLKRHGNVSFNGELVTDRILDINLEQYYGKDVVIIDDVVVSGTTIYTIIQKLKKAGAKSVRVYVLGINKDYYNPELFQYIDSNGLAKNYIQSPYIPVSDATCMRICSSIVSTFALDISPYDVDFPKHDFKSISKRDFEQIVACPEWHSYDVSSDLQSQNNIKNITLLPSERISNIFDEETGLPVSKLGFYKIRLFAKFNEKKQQYQVNAVPYFLFNEITANDINLIFEELIGNKLEKDINEIAKVRILQYVLAEKLFNIWNESVCNIFEKKIYWSIDKFAFQLIFPKDFFPYINEAIYSSQKLELELNTLSLDYPIEYKDSSFESCISMCNEQHDNMAVLQTKLIEPFTNLYFTKEKESRELVLKFGENAFGKPEYQHIIERLKHGYSYNMLIELLNEFPNIYDKVTTVSLFVDEAIDAGIIVPIIAVEEDKGNGKFYFRAYRHGEDVPFGELQEKLSSILLANYAKTGGVEILSKLRVEKMLVLFIRIGMKQGIFKPSPQDSIYYNVNIDSYLHGNIVTVQDLTSKRSYHYLKHRTDARWLSEVLRDKGIIREENNTIVSINDIIDIPIDKTTTAKVSAIGKTFAMLYKNKEENLIPCVTDDDLILFSTCMSPQDILNALASELAIFVDRWKTVKHTIDNLLKNNLEDIPKTVAKEDIYTSINSGQKKFFNFIEKKAQQRIDEISQQLNDNIDLSIYGTHWDQFWSDSRNWDRDSIDKQLFNTIISEGKYLMIFNMLCRMLFLCTASVSERSKWLIQIEEYQEKLCNDIFSHFQELKKIVDYSSEVVNTVKSSNKFDISTIIKICHLISYYTNFIPPLLSDVELLVDRHGKPCSISRYTHAILLSVPESCFALVRSTFDAYCSSQKIEYQVFPIAEPTNAFPESGMWFFVKGGQFSAINQLFSTCILRNIEKFSLRYAKIFYNLSENLRLKVNNNCNTKQHFGSFSSYASFVAQFGYQKKSNVTVYWVVEDSHANINLMNEMKNSCFIPLKSDKFAFETTTSSSSTIITCNLITMLEKYRKEYNNMTKKCEIFISYSEDSMEHIAKIEQIVERLQSENFNVYFYKDAPFGTDMVSFMRKIETCDIALIIGTPAYKERAYNKNDSGVNFEDKILTDVYMSEQREKIVPISFGSFEDSFPTPFNKLKGMSMSLPTKEELDVLVAGLINRYKINDAKN